MTPDRYTLEGIRSAVTADIDRLFAPWMVGRSENYVADRSTKNLISLSFWLDEELRRLGCNEADRKTQLRKYNRLSRSYDVWESAAECLNDVLEGNVEQGGRRHRRWG